MTRVNGKFTDRLPERARGFIRDWAPVGYIVALVAGVFGFAMAAGAIFGDGFDARKSYGALDQRIARLELAPGGGQGPASAPGPTAAPWEVEDERNPKDWIAVGYAPDWEPVMCWRLKSGLFYREVDSVTWVDSESGTKVRVIGGHIAYIHLATPSGVAEARSLGVDASLCGDGKYPKGK